ncbi:MAG: TetR/AcrR family transcriptional regulator [Pseudomonadota bacterium]
MSLFPPEVTESPFNRTVQHDAKRVAILSEAARLFNSRGSRATTLKDIAESLGLTKTSLYYYVKTKEALIYQCYMASLDYHHAKMDQVEEHYQRPAERASKALLNYFDTWLAAEEGRGPYIAALLEIASLGDEHRHAVEGRYIDLYKRLRQYLREGIKEGSIRQCHTSSATRAVLGSVEWLFFWLARVPREEVPQIARDALDIITHGIAAGPAVYNPGPLTPPAPQIQHVLSGFDRDEQNRLKQEAFCKVGTRFFNKQGFNGTSLDEIAEYLQVSKGAFYYHIKSKEDLLFACYERTQDIGQSLLEQLEASNMNGLEKLEQFCRQVFHVQTSELGPLVRFNTITDLPKERRKRVLERNEQANALQRSIIEQGMVDGSIRPINSFVAQQLISGAVNAAMDIKLWRKVDDFDQAGIEYFDVFLNGLQPR